MGGHRPGRPFSAFRMRSAWCCSLGSVRNHLEAQILSDVEALTRRARLLEPSAVPFYCLACLTGERSAREKRAVLRWREADSGAYEITMESKLMAKPLLQQCDDAPDASSTDDYTPKKYSVREHAVMGLKIFLMIGLLFGFLWLVSLLKGQ
jgi:hypothetical protein